jgi:hypothetical protein
MMKVAKYFISYLVKPKLFFVFRKAPYYGLVYPPVCAGVIGNLQPCALLFEEFEGIAFIHGPRHGRVSRICALFTRFGALRANFIWKFSACLLA